jgi:hypothetical protein
MIRRHFGWLCECFPRTAGVSVALERRLLFDHRGSRQADSARSVQAYSVGMGNHASVLSIGSVVGGATSANRAWRDAIQDLTRRVKEARTGFEAPLNVNVVFHVPGHLLAPDYAGVRTGTFSRSQRLLMVQVALPAEPPPDPAEYLQSAAQAAIDEAERWAQRRGLASDLSALRDIVSST